MRVRPLGFLLGFCLLFTSSTCDECEVLRLSDLILGAFNSNIAFVDNQDTYYELAHNVINTVEDILNCPDYEPVLAGPNTLQQGIWFSPNGTFDLTQPPLDVLDFGIPELDGGEQANAVDTLAFTTDGFYLVQGSADYYEEVEERREDNNIEQGEIEKSLLESPRVIHIEGRGTKPPKDANGNPVYILRHGSGVHVQR